MDGEKATETTDTGTAKVKVEKIPTEETILKIKLSGSGMNDFTKVLNVKLEKGSASDLKVFFKSEDGDQEVVGGITPTFSTTKTEGTVTVKTTSAEMSKVMVGGAEATLSEDKKSATYKLSVTGTDTDPQEVKVEVEFPYFKKAERTFKVAKYGNKNDFPLQLVSAKILSGDKGENTTVLDFDASNKASVEIGDVRFSTVELVMEFDQKLSKRDVEKCEDSRTTNYGSDLVDADLTGIFSGYITHDIDITKNNEEKSIENIKDKKYYEILIVGAGTVKYEIKVTSETMKEQKYIIEIKNTFTETPAPGSDEFLKGFMMFNGNSGRPIFYSLHRLLNLPYYAKGSTFSGNQLNKNGFDDLAYMDSVAMTMIWFKPEDKPNAPLQPFATYYNVMNDDGSKPKDEHKFKRIFAGIPQAKDRTLVFLNIDDMNDKYLDMFVSNEKNTPYPMLPLYYGKKWRKTSPKHGWLIKLSNKQQCNWTGVFQKPIEAKTLFDFAFNYRVQSIIYDNLNKTGSTGTKELTIAKKQKFVYWETGVETDLTSTPLLSGKETSEEKDVFSLNPVFDTKKVKVKEVKYTIKAGEDKDNCTEDATYKGVSAELDAKTGGYIFGKKNGSTEYFFKDGKVYKLEVEVEYDGVTEKDKFNYLIDYKNDQKLDLMDMADEGDFDSNLFGVPTSYGMKTINPAILEELATTRYTALSAM